jgi:crossover junction endodeoxyribonuclease RuvC
MRIIAIDPGYERMGVAVIEKETKGKDVLLFSECFKTSPKISHDQRLRLIGQEVEKVIADYQPKAMAIETLFFKNNQKTAMHVSEARGVMLYVAAVAGIPVHEFMPMAIKIAVTGYGGSDKDQVTMMVQKLIKIDREITYDDEYDAIAVGLTFFATCKIK